MNGNKQGIIIRKTSQSEEKQTRNYNPEDITEGWKQTRSKHLKDITEGWKQTRNKHLKDITEEVETNKE